MRHRVQKNKMNRDTDHRKALLRNLATSLILNGSIETTLAKAKFVKPYVEKLVTKAKKRDDIQMMNIITTKLTTKEASKVLYEDITQRFLTRNGGYTRIVKLGFRAGDKAPLARLEFVVDKKVETKEKVSQDTIIDEVSSKDSKGSKNESKDVTNASKKETKTKVKKASEKVETNKAETKKSKPTAKKASKENK